MSVKREWVRRPPPRVYTEVVDGQEFTLQEEGHPEPETWDPRSYVIRRDGEIVLGVHVRGKRYYLYSPSSPDAHHIGYVQHSRRGTLLAAALLLTRGLSPPPPELGEVNLRRLVAAYAAAPCPNPKRGPI